MVGICGILKIKKINELVALAAMVATCCYDVTIIMDSKPLELYVPNLSSCCLSHSGLITAVDHKAGN